MSRGPKTWTVVWTDYTPDEEGDDRGVQHHEVARDRASLEAKLILLSTTSSDYLVIPGEPLEIVVERSPRITINGRMTKPAVRKRKAKKTAEETT